MLPLHLDHSRKLRSSVSAGILDQKH
uniref:Uncharacterized protein n=1 Tax=Phlebotomus papatasi TaxID=29031 RepID=A0A1B0DPZ3_PHLPP